MKLLENLEIIQLSTTDASQVCRDAVDFLGVMVAKSGARVATGLGFESNSNEFLGRNKIYSDSENQLRLEQWLDSDKQVEAARIVVLASTPADECAEVLELAQKSGASVVIVRCEPHDTEASLFAESGLADLLGDPNRQPLVPNSSFAAGTIGYSGFTALIGCYVKLRRFQEIDVAELSGLSALSWVNWKAAAAAYYGKDIHREGDAAEWPSLPCKDGYVSFIYTERDWDAVCKMVGDERLKEDRFSTFALRAENREDYMSIIRAWAAPYTSAELDKLFVEHTVPGGAVKGIKNLLGDPLLEHRQAFDSVDGGWSPALPFRVEANYPASQAAKSQKAQQTADESSNLPLAGIRVLDLGIITAGAGASGLLADMGAEVLKIESETYPDPFRQWAGSSASPLFDCNNRNKWGVALDLKTEEGKAKMFELVKSADIVVENFRRGVLDRLGFSIDELKKVNPNIVLASISGLGLTGPGTNHTTFGSTLEALSGFASVTHYDDGIPVITGRNVNYPDQTVAYFAAGVMAAAIAHAQDTNQALQIDICQRDVAMFCMGPDIERVSRGGDLAAPIQAMWPVAEGRWICCPKLDAGLAEEIKVMNKDDAINYLQERGFKAQLVMYGSEMRLHQTVVNDGVFCEKDKKLLKGFPFQLQNAPMKVWAGAPQVGEHTDRFIS